MYSIVTTNNSTVLRYLGTPAFVRLRLATQVARDAAEARSLVQQVRPALALLDAELPDASGYELCAQIKADPSLGDTRVVLLVEGPLTPETIGRLHAARCDEALMIPVTGETLLHKVAQLLGMPSRLRRRMRICLGARLQGGQSDSIQVAGNVVDLSPDGARIALERPFGLERAELILRPSPGAPPLRLRAEVIWEADDGDGAQCGVAFRDLDLAARTVLEDLCLWELDLEPDGTTLVTFQGDFREHTRFERLAERLTGRVLFDLAYVRYLNSAGVRRWVEFLRALGDDVSYRFVRCSVAFVAQASMVPESTGRGHVESFLVPYACEACDFEEERLMQTAAVALPGLWPPELPVFRCPRCGEDLVFDDIAERYFAFLQSPDGRR